MGDLPLPVIPARPARRLPVGAEILPGGDVHFRVWAPRRNRVAVVVEGHARTGSAEPSTTVALKKESSGYFAGIVPSACEGSLYRFRLDDDDRLYPDPASRFQPDGPHGPSQVVDPSRFPWTDHHWRGVRLEGQVIYEMHIGTFTLEGTWRAAMQELPHLADTGLTVLELMPVAEFSGRFGWGYDGVNLFAPYHLYGSPDDMRAFVDRAHALGLGVILDVVYNHLGPDGNYLAEFSADYISNRDENAWGDAINFDGPNSASVREFFLANAGFWIDEFHVDGLRFDATQSIHDHGEPHILAELGQRVRDAARDRDTLLVAENEPQHVRMVQPIESGGFGIDAIWNDDLHHSVIVQVTGLREAYYTDHLGTPQEFISAIKWGFLYQGQRYSWQNQRRGTPTYGLSPAAFVVFSQNHDQIANSARGARLHLLTSPGRLRAVTALLLLAPGTPMLFQGQEFAASSPFFYFADQQAELARQVRRGRAEHLRQFPSVADYERIAGLDEPVSPETFERCKLDHAEREREGHAEVLRLHRDLLKLRREVSVFRAQRPGGVDGAVLGSEAFVLRYFDADGDSDDRLVMVNFGTTLQLEVVPEPLLAPPLGKRWGVQWSSESPEYGGFGTPPPETDTHWWIVGHATVVLQPVSPSERPRGRRGD